MRRNNLIIARRQWTSSLRRTRTSSKPSSATTDKKVNFALEAFEALFFNNMTLVLDRYFVHRLRMVTGKDGNPNFYPTP